MAVQRLLFAINHKDTEDAITAQLGNDYLCVGAVAYREAVLPAITEHHADLVVIRETLGGFLSMEDLAWQIRLECPDVRIIFLASQRRRGDPFLSLLVSYGIYDIIVSDAVQIQTIVSYILHPRTIRDVAVYFKPGTVLEDKPESPQPAAKHGGFLNGLFSRSPKPQEQKLEPDQAPEAVSGVNMAAIRASIEEAANRRAQQGVQEVIKREVETATRDLQRQLKEKEAALASANASLQGITRSEVSSSREIEILRNQLDALKQEHTKEVVGLQAANKEYEQRLLSTKSTHDPEWFLQKSKELEQERDALAERLKAAQREVEQLRQDAAENADLPRVDYSMEDGTIVLPDEGQPAAPVIGENHVYLFLGSKHGVGNTSAALNTAATLAATGQKTLLIEMNSRFPLLNHFLELTNLTAGIDTACNGVRQGNYRAVEAAIIKPHALMPANRALGKAYKRLPGNLHFMLFTNNYLVNRPGFDLACFKDVIQALQMQSKYGYIVIDVQSDEPDLFRVCVDGGFLADKLVLTVTQDPHAIASAGYLVTALAKSASAKLLRSMTILVNQYIPSVEPKLGKIAKYLSVSGKQCFAISMAREGYIKSAMAAVPYIYNGQTGEYQALADAIRKN